MVENKMKRRFQILKLVVKLHHIYRQVDKLRQRGAAPEVLDEKFTQAGRAIRETCNLLFGVIVKAGQFLSLRRELFPPAFTRELQGLQDQVPPASWNLIKQSLECELGRPLSEVFLQIQEQPVAAASISQVHRAVLQTGETVAVKILRPHIERLAAIDLATLGKALRLMSRLPSVRSRMDFAALHREFSQTIEQELDMRGEAENMERFRREYGNDDMVVPKVFEAYTTKRMLVMDYVEGVSIRDTESMTQWRVDPVPLRNALLSLYVRQILVDGFVHLDPHPGNLLVLPDGRLALLDFGMVGELSHDERQSLRHLLQGIFWRDGQTIAEVLSELGYLRPDADFAEFLERFHDAFSPLNPAGVKRILTMQSFQLQARYMLLVRCIGLLKTVVTGLTPAEDDWMQVMVTVAMPWLSHVAGEGDESHSVRQGLNLS